MNNLTDLFNIQSYYGSESSMQLYILSQLSHIEGVTVTHDEHGNIYAAKGVSDAYVNVMCHIDTVFDIHDDHAVIIDQGVIYPATADTGVGGDDKCGIFACLELLRRCPALRATFFSGEECGCIGSSAADLDRFDGVGLLLSIDRRGRGDLILDYWGVPSVSGAFLATSMTTFNNHGFSPAAGSVTDCFAVQRRLGDVCALNVSCGYYNPHTTNEYVVIAELMNCIDMVEALVKVCDGTRWDWSPAPRVTHSLRSYVDCDWDGLGCGEVNEADHWGDRYSYLDYDAAADEIDLTDVTFTDCGVMMFEDGEYTVQELTIDREIIGYKLLSSRGRTYFKLSPDESMLDAYDDFETMIKVAEWPYL